MTNVKIVLGLLLTMLAGSRVAASASAAIFEFDFEARIASSNIANVPQHNLLQGRFSYGPDAVRYQVDGDYFMYPGAADLKLWTDNGFDLDIGLALLHVYSGMTHDEVILQSALSVPPNDWFVTVEMRAAPEQGWLNGQTSMPESYPSSFESAYVQAIFTDEYEEAEFFEWQITSVERRVGDETAASVRRDKILRYSSVILQAVDSG